MSKHNPNRETLSIADVADYLGLSLSGATNLFHSVNFPSFKIGKRWFIRRVTFESWLQEQEEKGA